MSYVIHRILNNGRILQEGKTFPSKKLAKEAADWYIKKGFKVKVVTKENPK